MLEGKIPLYLQLSDAAQQMLCQNTLTSGASYYPIILFSEKAASQCYAATTVLHRTYAG